MTALEILTVLNRTAYKYETTKNLIKACRKALAGKVDIISCEVNSAGYRDVICLDLDTNEKIHFKLVENEEGIYFDSLEAPKELNFFAMIDDLKKNSKTDYAKGFNDALDMAKEVFLKHIANKVRTESMEKDGYEVEDDEE